MIVPPHREGGQAQFIAQPVPKNTRDARINGLLEYLQQHIREPHNLDSLAQVAAHLSSPDLTAEGGAVDNEAVFHVAFNHSLPGLVNLIAANQLNIGDDAVLGAEIKHLLGFRDAADHRPGN